MRRPATLACLLVASILLTGCAENSSGRNMPPIGSGPASGGTDSADETGGIDGVYCDADFAYARVNLAAERGTIFDRPFIQVLWYPSDPPRE